jgi:hypothetical protein
MGAHHTREGRHHRVRVPGRSRARLLVLGLIVLTLPVISDARSASALPTGAPTNVTAIATSPSTATVSWIVNEPPAAHLVGLYQTIGTAKEQVGGNIACGTCTSLTFDGLAAGTNYAIVLYAVTATSWSTGTWVSFSTPSGSCAGLAGLCVTVDPSRPTGALGHIGNGLNLGATQATPASVLTPIAPRYWRISGMDVWAYSFARQAGASVNAVLSNNFAYNNADSTGRLLRNPWEDWAGYRAFVIRAVQYAIANNIVPDVWEIQNEPDADNYYSKTVPPTRERILEQHRIAHDAIRSVLPDAKIVGPALATFHLANAAAAMDFTTFLDYAVANNLRFDVLSWNELGKYRYGGVEADPRAILDHVSQLRSALAQRPSLGQPAFSVGEYTAGWWLNHPGAAARYMAVLEDAGVATAASSCFLITVRVNILLTRTYNTCTSSPGLLDGLRAPDGQTNAAYWVHAGLAAMTGTKLATATTERWTTAVTALAPDGSMSVLIGRAHGCDGRFQQYCPSFATPDPTAEAKIAMPRTATMANSYQVTVQRIRNVGLLAGPATSTAPTATASNGTFVIPIPGGIADGDAVIVRLVPA